MNRDKELGTLDLASRYKHCSTMTNSGFELDNFDFGKEDLRKADEEEKERLATRERETGEAARKKQPRPTLRREVGEEGARS